MKVKTLEIFGTKESGDVNGALLQMVDEIQFCSWMTDVVGIEPSMDIEAEHPRNYEPSKTGFVFNVGGDQFEIRELHGKEFKFRVGQYDDFLGKTFGFEVETARRILRDTKRVLLLTYPKKSSRTVELIALVLATVVAHELEGVMTNGENKWFSAKHTDLLAWNSR